MARNRYFDRRDLTLVQQAYYMSVDYPGFVGRMMKNAIEWVGSVKPTPMSDTYLIRIYYKIPDRPEVIVLSPELQVASGHHHLPHTFPPEWKRLCLHMSPDWNSQKPVNWIVPWIALWLYFYEIWRVTSVWLGEGHEPRDTDGNNVSNS
jgi:hypothetical protein